MSLILLAYCGTCAMEVNGEDQIEFVAYGDWGKGTSDLQATINSVATIVPDRDFVLLMGDNAYPAGFNSPTDPQFSVFRDIVADKVTYPHYLVLGNHDYMGDINAQIEFAKSEPRWILPSRYYKQMVESPGVSICLLVIDTVNFDSDQVTWLTTQLETPECNTNNAWTIVSGHYPIWSSGTYRDSPELKAVLLPILHQFNVQLYLCGHEHHHEVFYDGKVVQVASGSSAVPNNPLQFQPHSQQIWGVSGKNTMGFIHLSSMTDSIIVRIVSSRSQKAFVEFTITRDGDRESMFGHIHWSYTDSNADAVIADEDPGSHAAATVTAYLAILAAVLYF